jgi:hypothetical protein
MLENDKKLGKKLLLGNWRKILNDNRRSPDNR